jgi:hypothetical protein
MIEKQFGHVRAARRIADPAALAQWLCTISK